MLTELCLYLLIPMVFLIIVLLCLQGLPAIVGCDKVTQVFRSGDVVILDGSKGTITRVDAS
jgi:phosphohistidine swiveling domain-containing protein